MAFYRSIGITYDKFVQISENENAFKAIESAITGGDTFRILLSSGKGTGKHHMLEEIKRRHGIFSLAMEARFLNELMVTGRRRTRTQQVKECVQDSEISIVYNIDELDNFFCEEEWFHFLMKKRVILTAKTNFKDFPSSLKSLLQGFGYIEVSMEELSFDSRMRILNEFIRDYGLNVESQKINRLLEETRDLDQIKENLWREFYESSSYS